MSKIRAQAALAAAVLVLTLAGCAGTTPGTGQDAGQSLAASSRSPAADQFAGAPEGTATLEGAVQRISVDVSQGFYDPTIIYVKAGVPVEIAFGQGEGCLAQVQFPDAGIDQDLTQGGATVKLPAMRAGEYEFHCGMSMVYGKVVAR